MLLSLLPPELWSDIIACWLDTIDDLIQLDISIANREIRVEYCQWLEYVGVLPVRYCVSVKSDDGESFGTLLKWIRCRSLRGIENLSLRINSKTQQLIPNDERNVLGLKLLHLNVTCNDFELSLEQCLQTSTSLECLTVTSSQPFSINFSAIDSNFTFQSLTTIHLERPAFSSLDMIDPFVNALSRCPYLVNCIFKNISVSPLFLLASFIGHFPRQQLQQLHLENAISAPYNGRANDMQPCIDECLRKNSASFSHLKQFSLLGESYAPITHLVFHLVVDYFPVLETLFVGYNDISAYLIEEESVDSYYSNFPPARMPAGTTCHLRSLRLYQLQMESQLWRKWFNYLGNHLETIDFHDINVEPPEYGTLANACWNSIQSIALTSCYHSCHHFFRAQPQFPVLHTIKLFKTDVSIHVLLYLFGKKGDVYEADVITTKTLHNDDAAFTKLERNLKQPKREAIRQDNSNVSLNVALPSLNHLFFYRVLISTLRPEDTLLIPEVIFTSSNAIRLKPLVLECSLDGMDGQYEDEEYHICFTDTILHRWERTFLPIFPKLHTLSISCLAFHGKVLPLFFARFPSLRMLRLMAVYGNNPASLYIPKYYENIPNSLSEVSITHHGVVYGYSPTYTELKHILRQCQTIRCFFREKCYLTLSSEERDSKECCGDRIQNAPVGEADTIFYKELFQNL
jgi:hypothetical protein